MIAGYTAEQVRAAERPHLAAGEPLMLRAAAALARVVADAAGAGRTGTPAVVLVVGSGDNGGDAMFAGAELARRGASVSIVPVGSRLHEAGSAAALAAGARRLDHRGPEVAAALASADVIVDGVLGTGSAASPALREPARSVVELARARLAAAHPPRVVAVDLPSGIHPDTGEVPDPTVLPADVTVTFGACKAGLLRRPGADYAGEVLVVDIGIGDALAGVEPAIVVPD
ncbi:NAD(P)H-hydrate epimerase [Agromyces sp. SYSU T00194]|uniref:NAD(P)H-hydrate epimerase n=1 Tax=Agromyces chitinivorans TaxID=3158560 RepID=UPI0033991CF1